MSTVVNLRSILDANKLSSANFMDWIRNLRIVLKGERITYVLDIPLLVSPTVDASDEDHMEYQNHLDDNVISICIMLASTLLELQKQHEAMIAHAIVLHLKVLFHE